MKLRMLAIALAVQLAAAGVAPAQDIFDAPPSADASDPFGDGLPSAPAPDPFAAPPGAADPFAQPPAEPPTIEAPTVDAPSPLPSRTPFPTSVPPVAEAAVGPGAAPAADALASADESGEATPEDGVAGTVRRVTLYREQAMVTREIDVPAGDDDGAITVINLPEQIVADSVFAEGDGNIQVRAVRVTSRAILSSDREEVRQLEESIAANQQAQARAEQELRIISENLNSLTQITAFSANQSNQDLNRGVLNAETVTQLGGYLMEQRRELMMNQLEKQQEIAALTKELGLLQFRMNDLVAGNRSQRYQAKIFIEAAPNVGGTVKLNYLVGGCGWSPQYTIRGWVDRDSFSIRYSAMVQQISGEPWDNVDLTLSTASPSVSATGPTLTPFRISTSDSAVQTAQAAPADASFDGSQLAERAKSIRRQQRSVEYGAAGKLQSNAPAQRDVQLNQLAGELQQLELLAEAKTAARIAEDADDEVATQVYRLEQPVSIESRRQQQLVQISELELEGKMYHVAVPLLASYAYREAEVTNSSEIGLLGGPASVYLDDRFVGQTPVLTTASGQKLLLGFGADQQVRTRRELRSKEDAIRGGNRHLVFSYRLVVSNFKDKSVAVRLYDRIPISDETREVAVNLVNPEIPLSEDKLYERIAKPRGILRWDVEVPEDRNGSEAYDVEYTYSLEFDRSLVLTAEELAQQIEADYFFQQRAGGMGGGMGGMMGSGQQ